MSKNKINSVVNDQSISILEKYKSAFKRIPNQTQRNFYRTENHQKKLFNVSELNHSLIDAIFYRSDFTTHQQRIEHIKNLFKLNADPNMRDQRGNNPIKQSIINEDIEIVELFLEYGFNINEPVINRTKQTALEFAKIYNNKEIIELLEQALINDQISAPLIPDEPNNFSF